MKKYCYRNTLNIFLRKDCDNFKRAIENHQNVIITNKNRHLSKIIDAVMLDNPQLFYVCWNREFKIYNINGECRVKIYYNCEIDERLKRERGFYEIAKSFSNNKSQREIICDVYKYVTENIFYDITDKSTCSNLIGGMLFGRASCQGVSMTIKYIFDVLNIPSFILAGKIKGDEENHVWNVVRLDNKWYHLDATNDLKCNSFCGRYDFCLLSDKQIKNTHIFKGKFNKDAENKNDYFEYKQRCFEDIISLRLAVMSLKDNVREFSFRFTQKINIFEVQNLFQGMLDIKYKGKAFNLKTIAGNSNCFYLAWIVGK